MENHILIINALVLTLVSAQQYDFGAEITRQCLVPDPVGLLDCVENKVDLPYLSSWVECTNSLGQNVATSADIINYRCKSVWEGKGVIPEVFYIKDCVIEKTGLPAKNVSAEVLGAYKECESNPAGQQQQQNRQANLARAAPPYVSSVSYSGGPQQIPLAPAPQQIKYQPAVQQTRPVQAPAQYRPNLQPVYQPVQAPVQYQPPPQFAAFQKPLQFVPTSKGGFYYTFY